MRKMRDFECLSCGHKWEMLVQDNEIPTCPKCTTGEVQRQLSAPGGIEFRGIKATCSMNTTK